jgi:hypothetical protein
VGSGRWGRERAAAVPSHLRGGPGRQSPHEKNTFLLPWSSQPGHAAPTDRKIAPTIRDGFRLVLAITPQPLPTPPQPPLHGRVGPGDRRDWTNGQAMHYAFCVSRPEILGNSNFGLRCADKFEKVAGPWLRLVFDLAVPGARRYFSICKVSGGPGILGSPLPSQRGTTSSPAAPGMQAR